MHLRTVLSNVTGIFAALSDLLVVPFLLAVVAAAYWYVVLAAETFGVGLGYASAGLNESE